MTITEDRSMNHRIQVHPHIFAQHPDFRTIILYAFGITNQASNDTSRTLQRTALSAARGALGDRLTSEESHVASWREAYRSFGAKPKKYQCSVEALLKRGLKDGELPEINYLVDVYNALSVQHVLPIGGEDYDKLESDLMLHFADGTEAFHTREGGEGAVEHPESGEVIYSDSAGVTCRRWNWRQGSRTLLTEDTTSAYFILEALGDYPTDQLQQVADELTQHIRDLSPAAEVKQEFLSPETVAQAS